MRMNEIEAIAARVSDNDYFVTHRRDEWYMFTFHSYPHSIFFLNVLENNNVRAFSSGTNGPTVEESTTFSVSVKVDTTL